MDLKERKKQIKKNHFSTNGMVIISILGMLGVFICLISDILNINDYKTYYSYLSKNGVSIIFGIFFIFVALYCWLAFFKNIILNPKKEILFLIKREHNMSIFVNKKGKKFTIKDIDKKESKFYYVFKTSDYIYEVLDDECNLDEIWKEKKSYWLNFYSPMGNFEEILLLPIVYIVLMIGLLSLLMSKGYDKIYGLIFSAIPLYVIGYDFIYKLKLKKNDVNEIDQTKFINSYLILKKIVAILITAIVFIIFTNIFLKMQSDISKLIFAPFYLCGILTCCIMISKEFNKHFLYKLFLKSVIIIFLLFWFGFITFCIIGLIKQENNYIYMLIGIPFYIIGIIAFKKYILEK